MTKNWSYLLLIGLLLASSWLWQEEETPQERYEELRGRAYGHVEELIALLRQVRSGRDFSLVASEAERRFVALALLMREARPLLEKWPPPPLAPHGQQLNEQLAFEMERISRLIQGRDQLAWSQMRGLELLDKP